MKKIVSLLIGFLLFFHTSAQLAEKNLNIYTGYTTGNFFGKEMSDDNGFIYPNLYSNMSKLNGFSLKATYRIHSLFSIGLEGGDIIGTNRTSADNHLYNGAEINLRSVSPLFQIHSLYKETGIFNLMKFYGEVAPVFGQSKLQLQNPIFVISSAGKSETEFMETTDNYFGIKGGAGIEFAFSKDAGLNLSYSVQQNFISSALYNDEKFFYGQLSIGLFFRLIFDKRFRY